MPFSPELQKVISKFYDIDPATQSINDQMEPVAKRVWWQNTLGFLIYIITCGLISQNPKLDEGTKKIVNLTREFFRANNTPSDENLAELKIFLTKLETIVVNNRGANYSQLHALADRVDRLQREVTVEPMEEDPNASLTTLLARNPPPGPKIAQKVKMLMNACKKEDLLSGLNSVSSDKDLFFPLLATICHYSRNPDWTLDLLHDASWPEDVHTDLKTEKLALFYQDNTLLCQPTLSQLLDSDREKIAARLVALYNYEDFDELKAACEAANNPVQMNLLLTLVVDQARSNRVDIRAIFETIAWQSEKLKIQAMEMIG